MGTQQQRTVDVFENDIEDFRDKEKIREANLTARISNLRDPIDAINTIVHNEGSNLKALWESEAGYPVDGVLLCIVFLPIALGVLGSYISRMYEPRLVGEELYDDYGNRIVEFPKMSIAYLQQARKDQSAARENRNSLAWLCHTWLISTNDVVQELQAPYPLDENAVTGWGTVKAISRLYSMLRQVAKDWRQNQHRNLKSEEHKDDEALAAAENAEADDEQLFGKGLGIPKTKRKLQTIFKESQVSDILYIECRLYQARRLYYKLISWVDEYDRRHAEEGEHMEGQEPREHSSDSDDSYWSSSETFSSDSGEHWKNYKNTTNKWAHSKKLEMGWKVENKKRHVKTFKFQDSTTSTVTNKGVSKRTSITDDKSSSATVKPGKKKNLIGIQTQPSIANRKGNKLTQKAYKQIAKK